MSQRILPFTLTRVISSGVVSILLTSCVIKQGLEESDPPEEAGEEVTATGDDQDRDGFSVEEGDCDDERYDVNPSRVEICGDGVDQDCDGADLVCESVDRDGDGFSTLEGDCDDDNVSIGPNRIDICDDGIDQDCTGRDQPCDEVDLDGDGYSVVTGDCGEEDLQRYPGAPEICGDGIDQDCDGADLACEDRDRDDDGIADRLDHCPDVFDVRNLDSDGDGYGDACDNCPRDPNPGQRDSDNDGRGDACPPDAERDQDGDGVTASAGDCDDQDPTIAPNQEEQCDPIDHDCDGYPDEGCASDLRSPTVSFSRGQSRLGSEQADPAACLRNPDSDENCDEVPAIEVTLSPFEIEIHEVTNAQYRRCVEAGQCTPPLRVASVASSLRYEDPAFDQHPVTWVDQARAQRYCAWLGARLPTEAEWERAARDQTPLAERRYVTGDSPPSCAQANLSGCADDTRPVQSTPQDQTASGVYDLTGNVHEHVAGYYSSTYYRDVARVDPPPLTTPNDREQIPVRGGSYRTTYAFSTLSYRGFRLLMRRDRALPEVGFRCVYGR